MSTVTGSGALEGALRAMAIGRLVIGAVSRLSPPLASKPSGAGPGVGPELDYMTKVFGARAIALGAGYLLSEGEARRLWQRLALFCDVSDTLAGAAAVRRGEIPAQAAIGLTALTGSYAAIGAVRVLGDARDGR